MQIHELELTQRSLNGLKAAGITKVEQLVELDWQQLAEIKNIGTKSLSEICWTCIQLLNGQMTEQRLDWEKQWPDSTLTIEKFNERYRKSQKYDEIVNLIKEQP